MIKEEKKYPKITINSFVLRRISSPLEVCQDSEMIYVVENVLLNGSQSKNKNISLLKNRLPVSSIEYASLGHLKGFSKI